MKYNHSSDNDGGIFAWPRKGPRSSLEDKLAYIDLVEQGMRTIKIEH